MVQKQIQIVRIIMLLTLLLLWGCLESALTFQVRYAEVSGLKQNDPVYFEQNQVGNVQKVSYTKQGDYLVDLSIAPEFKNAATVDSKFFIGNDQMTKQQSKAVFIEQERPGGALLEKGAIVQGAVKGGFLAEMMSGFRRNADAAGDEMNQAMQQLKESLNEASQQLDAELEGTLDDLSRQFHAFGEEMKKVPDSEEVKQLEDSIKQFADEFNRAQKDVRDHIQNEVLPQLRKELDQLRERLHEQGREEEIEEIDKQVEQMTMV